MKVGFLLVLFNSMSCPGHPGGGEGGKGAEAGQGHEDPQGVQGNNFEHDLSLPFQLGCHFNIMQCLNE